MQQYKASIDSIIVVANNNSGTGKKQVTSHIRETRIYTYITTVLLTKVYIQHICNSKHKG